MMYLDKCYSGGQMLWRTWMPWRIGQMLVVMYVMAYWINASGRYMLWGIESYCPLTTFPRCGTSTDR